VDRVSFEVATGEVLGFLGPNGAGKTTTLKMLTGLLPPTSGQATVAGLEVPRDAVALRARIGYMSQKFSLYGDLTAGENLDLFAGLYGVRGERLAARRAWALRMAGLEGHEDRLTAELPLGWKQRLALGCAVLHEPSLLFLDEPTSGVDPMARRAFWDLIYELAAAGTTVLVSTHYMEEASTATGCSCTAAHHRAGPAGRPARSDRAHSLPHRPRAACSRALQHTEACARRLFGATCTVRPDHADRAHQAVLRPQHAVRAQAGRAIARGRLRRPGATRGRGGERMRSGRRGVDSAPERGRPEAARPDRRAPALHLGRLLAVARKETLQLRRDARSLALAFLLPLGLLLFFGYAINWDLHDIPIAIRDEDGTGASRELVAALEGSGFFQVTERLESRALIDDRLHHGRVRAVLVIPRGFSRDLAAGRRAPAQLLLDGSDANTATITMNYADAIVARWSSQVVLRGRELPGLAEAEPRVWYNPTLASRNMIVPGLIAVIMSIIAAMLTALTIAREWERGTMEQLAATPVHRLEVVFGKLLPYVAIGFFDVVTTTILGITLFWRAPARHDAAAGRHDPAVPARRAQSGIFISAALKSQVLATQVALVATYLPALLLSGFIFDVGGMPAVLQGISRIVPARYFIAVTRGIFLKGVGLEVLWVQGLSMILFAAVGIGAATAAFRKRISA
jgi:ABC-type Na+ transport system ATPase subunit NatA/ABC-type multidrug transport system permease subunit